MKTLWPKILKRLETNLVTGLVLIIPISVTALIFYKLFKVSDSVLPSLLHAITPRIPAQWIPGVGILIFLVLVYLVGTVARNWLGRKIIDVGNSLIVKIPFFSKVYIGLHEILDAVVNNRKRKLFEKVVLVEFPLAGTYAIGLLTSRATGEIAQKAGQDMVAVFIPKAPNPATGFVLFYPASKVVELDMSVETALKSVMSCGLLSSDAALATEKVNMPGALKKWNWLGSFRKYRHGELSADPRD